MYYYTLTGRPISKKNSRRIFRRGRKLVNIPSSAYEKWENHALVQLMGVEKPRISTPVHIEYIFTFKGKMQSDLDNIEAGINDILEKAGIIEDDVLIEGKSVPRVKRGAKDWMTEIIITPY